MKRKLIGCVLLGVVLALMGLTQNLLGEVYRTPNFISENKAVVDRAEFARKECAEFWTGKTLPEWNKPCPIFVKRSLDEGGMTQFQFNMNEVFGWRMEAQGPSKGLQENVIPHEVDHAVRASLVRHPMERWLDEGAACLFETKYMHEFYRRETSKLLRQKNPVAFRYLTSTRYPANGRDTFGLYATGFSLVEYLIQRKDAATLLAFQKSALPVDRRFQQFYGAAPAQIQAEWMAWFNEKSKIGFDCETFACCRHTVKKQEFVVKPQLYVFTQPACPGCERFKADHKAGYYNAYDVTYIERNADTNWKFPGETYAWMRESIPTLPGDSRKLGVPFFWMPSSKRVKVGYAVNKQERLGLIDWIIETIKHHMIPKVFLENPDREPQGIVQNGPASGIPIGEGAFVQLENTSSVPLPADEETAPAEIAWSDLTVAVAVGKLTDYVPTIRREVVDRLTRQIDKVVLDRTQGKLLVRVVAEVSEPVRHHALATAMGVDDSKVALVVFVRRQSLGFVKSKVRDLIVREINERVGEVLRDAPVVVVMESAEPSAYHAGLAILAQPEPEQLPDVPAISPLPDPISSEHVEPGQLGKVLHLVEQVSKEVKAIKERNADDDPTNDGPSSPVGVILSAVVALVVRRLSLLQGLIGLVRKVVPKDEVI